MLSDHLLRKLWVEGTSEPSTLWAALTTHHSAHTPPAPGQHCGAADMTSRKQKRALKSTSLSLLILSVFLGGTVAQIHLASPLLLI